MLGGIWEYGRSLLRPYSSNCCLENPPLPHEDLELGSSFGLLLYSGSPVVGVYAVRRFLDNSPLFVRLLPKGGNSRVLGP